MKHFSKARSGSALLMTLLVVSLLLLIVVAFSIFVRMELKQVVQHQNLLQARSNARLGANLAIASLQEMAGPDTRVTAPLPDSSGAPPNRQWLGRVVDSAAYLQNGSNLVANPNFAQDLGYFLSVEDSATFNPDSYFPFNGDGSASSGHTLLVGPGSVSTTLDDNGDGVPDGYVAAPVRSLNSGPEGAYSWWIRDEGLKAQLNLMDPVLASTGTLDNREQALTLQRNASERLLPGYDPTDAADNELLGRAVLAEQFDLTSWESNSFSKKFFHDVTLQSIGLPTNPRRGGLKRDITAVMKEMEANGGAVDTSGAQWTQLMDYQEKKIERWRAETVALSALASRPAAYPLRHWNALQVLTLRADQADSSLNTKVFPPMTDMHVQWDLGGASWQQLLSWSTLRQRLEGSRGIVPKRRWQENMQLSPVIAKFNISTHFTLDYPDAALHMIPVVTLWNPYNVPIVMDSARPWTVTMEMDSEDWVSKKIRLKVRHPRWEAPNTSNFSHIVPRDELWTPPFFFDWNTDGGTGLQKDYQFQLRDASGGTNLVLPPGEAIMFAMHEHEELTRDSRGRLNVQVELRAGLAPDGLYSFYATDNLADKITVDRKAYVGGNRNFDNRSNGVEDINEHAYKTYGLASGGYNEWHQTGTRRRSNNNAIYRNVRSLPFPFPLATNRLAQTSAIGNLAKIPPPEDEDICINVNGLDGWEILEIGAETGRPAQEGANWRNFRFQLYESGSRDWPLVDVMHPNMELPKAIHFARVEDSPGTSGGDSICPIWVPEDIPSANEPFTPATRGFPAWGHSFGLRMPDHSYVFDSTTTQGAAVAAPIRWLTDFTPLFPFPNRDPSSRIQSAGGWRFNRRGFKSAPMYVGGFFMGDNRYADFSWSTPNDLNQFVGHSDDSLPGYLPGDVPKAILIDVPQDAEDIVSVASWMHAPLVSTHHALHPSDNRALPGGSIGSRYSKDGVTYTVAFRTAHPGFAQPTYTIGNSNAHFFVERGRGEQSFFPHPSISNPSESIPFLSNRGPADVSNGDESYLPMYDFSWVYNEVLWDDFFFTPESNQRLLWDGVTTAADRDFTTSAENLLVSGSFNVNSTSVPAWAVLLQGMMGVDLGDGDSTTSNTAAFSRFVEPDNVSFERGYDDFSSPTAYSGYRRLTPEEIWNDNGTPDNTTDDSGLAVEIVKQVKERGPFLSLSDFVNRSLLSEADDTEGHGLKGALQQAIEDAGLNEDMGDASIPESWVDSATEYPAGNSFYELSPANAEGRSNDGAPGALMQADILARVGSVLQARSDTFTIRVMGLAGDPDDPVGKAWCEVKVQRRSNYVDPVANAPGDLPADLNAVNLGFGRRFEVIEFRWLGEEEI